MKIDKLYQSFLLNLPSNSSPLVWCFLLLLHVNLCVNYQNIGDFFLQSDGT